MLGRLGGKPPKFYGSVTVAKRGQVSIPAEARRDLGIMPSTKLLVFSGQGKKALMLVKAESVSEFIANATAMLSNFEQMLKSSPLETSKENRQKTDFRHKYCNQPFDSSRVINSEDDIH